MILSKRILFLTALAGVLTLGGCSYGQMLKIAEEQDVQVNPSPLELHGDSVKFSISATLPLNMLKKNKLYSVKTKYAYGDQEEEFENLEFTLAEFENQDVEQPNISQEISFFYTEEMKQGALTVQGIVSNLEKTKFKETPTMDLAQGVITTSQLVKDVTYTSYADHGYNNKEELVPTHVGFFFDKGQSKLKRSEVQGDEGKKTRCFYCLKNSYQNGDNNRFSLTRRS
jgi:hypothetical protein